MERVRGVAAGLQPAGIGLGGGNDDRIGGDRRIGDLLGVLQHGFALARQNGILIAEVEQVLGGAAAQQQQRDHGKCKELTLHPRAHPGIYCAAGCLSSRCGARSEIITWARWRKFGGAS